MAATPSNMLPIGSLMPSFSLIDAVTNREVDTKQLPPSRGYLIAFICNHCPFVIHIRQALVQIAHEALDLGLQVIAVNSNSIESHPQDGPENMKALAVSEAWRFPFVFDATQELAKAFMAACTPDIYLFDAERRLAYRGQFDDSRPSNGKPVTGTDLRAAVVAVASGRPVTIEQKPSIGCNIKWRAA